MFLSQNIREGPSRRMMGLVGKENLVESIAGLVSIVILASLVLVLILAGWRDALFVTVAGLTGYGVDQWVEVVFLSLGLTDEPTYHLIVGPVVWAIAALVMVAVRIYH